MKLKLGQKIQITSDFNLELQTGGVAKVKKGDIAQIVRKIDDTTAEVVFVNGEAKGKSKNLEIEVDDDINADEIAKKIMQKIYSE